MGVVISATPFSLPTHSSPNVLVLLWKVLKLVSKRENEDVRRLEDPLIVKMFPYGTSCMVVLQDAIVNFYIYSCG